MLIIQGVSLSTQNQTKLYSLNKDKMKKIQELRVKKTDKDLHRQGQEHFKSNLVSMVRT